MTAGTKTFTLVNVYAPNKDDPEFLGKVIEYALSFACEDIFFGGDFNTVLDVKRGGTNTNNHKQSVKKIEEIMANLDPTDIWRDLHPQDSVSTWRQRTPEAHCRLDFFLISQGMVTCVANAEISPGYKMDHSMITISINTNTHPRGRGFWKLNTSLNDKEYVNQIKETITEVLQEYESDNAVDDSLLWEMIKLKIRECSLKYAGIKKAKRKNTEAELDADISHHERKLERNDLSNEEKKTIINELASKKQAFEEINRRKTKGYIIIICNRAGFCLIRENIRASLVEPWFVFSRDCRSSQNTHGETKQALIFSRI